ncbi:MAG TPA: 1-deoxy-D-xylulose-5-phosphate synthase N-terminal domain-containing protein [Vicinamibacterales bacterium]|jgi:transketolase|nr:1-deoxy-D-xylulose-5-phosphate synthase N-terminal domain-containing protein [Vicinamibacterales bacterium]
MTSDARATLSARACRVRERIIRMSAGGGCFIGASLSCADLIVYLYASVLNVSPETKTSAERDYLFLSKGHDVPALYGTLAEFGFFDEKRLAHHLSPRDSIYWHPNRAIAGVEFHSGSLGHLPAVALGVAMDIKMTGGSNRVFVIVGDGELNEGSVWEAVLVAAARKLDNIVFIVDRNEFQANVRTEDLVPLEPIEAKFAAFGWGTDRINGHDFDDMERSFARLPIERGKPSVVVANTVRGKGLASMERRADRWFVALTSKEAAALIDELHGDAEVVLTSEARMVR